MNVRTFTAAAAAGALTLAMAGLAHGNPIARVATGFIASEVCSGTFISGLDPDRIYQETTSSLSGAKYVSWAAHMKVDRVARTVSVTLFGGSRSVSAYTPGLGCRLVYGAPPAIANGNAPGPAGSPPDLVSAAPPLGAIVEASFTEPATGPRRNTHAVVIMRDGQVIAERYAAGYGPRTLVHGFSATKTVTATLIGILVRQGKLTLDQPAPIAAWRGAGDPRGAITVGQLLRHTSGLAMGDSFNGSLSSSLDRVNRMKFTQADMAGYAAASPLGDPPGTRWIYQDGNYVLLGRLIGDAAGGGAGGMVAFARHELFDPLGMGPVILETDTAGTFDGSTQMFASPRDWARFGQFLLDDGRVGETRILPAGWVQSAAEPTPGSRPGIGAGMWSNRGDTFGARRRIGEGFPADAYMARGMFGQYVIVIPSRRLVIARFGVSPGDGDEAGVARLVREVVAMVDAEPRG